MLTDVGDVRLFVSMVAVASAVWFALFSATGLNRVRVHDDKLIEKGKQLSRKRLKNSTPWFILAYSPRGAERIEFEDDAENAQQ